MHADLDLTGEDRRLDPAHEARLVADVGVGRAHRDDLGAVERLGDPLRLDSRERAAARAQPQPAHLPRRRRRSCRSETSAPGASSGSLSGSRPKSSRSTATFA